MTYRFHMAKPLRRPAGGFTLIELLVVLVIIAVMAAIVVPKFANRGQQSREAALKSDLRLVRSAVQMFQTDTEAYPTKLADLTATTAPAKGVDAKGTSVTITAANWKGPYLQGTVPNDPIANKAFTYSRGTLTSSATGTALDGTKYSTW
jgi:general secretion pathway protein G